MLIDTHCHIHWDNYPLEINDVIDSAHRAGVMQMICIGTDVASSKAAIDFAAAQEGVFASVGVHPIDSKEGLGDLENLIDPNDRLIVAVGEIGLDYYHKESPREVQIELLNRQIEIALRHELPIIFHVRDAFEDFWPIFDGFVSGGRQVRGELHSFTDNLKNAEKALMRGLYIGVNGFGTFTKNEEQKQVYATIPLDRLLLETDAPFLTPVPFRGKVNEPAYVREIANWQSEIRQVNFDEIADKTTANAKKLFGL